MKWLLFSLLLTNCAGVRRMGISLTAPAIHKAGDAFTVESNWEQFRSAIPANLKLMEGLLQSAPHNEKLLAALVKGHAGMAYGVWETRFLGERWADREGSFPRRQAVEGYSKAIGHGLQYLSQQGVSLDDLHRHLRKPNGVQKLLADKMGDDLWDIEAIFFTAQALAGLINLQKQNIAVVGELALAKALFDRACKLRPDFHFGACELFYGSYQSSRPRMMGGNPKKGRKIFERAIRQYPQNYLLRVAFIEHYIIPMGDEALYKKQKKILEKASHEHRKNLIWNPTRPVKPSPLSLYQAIALKRFELLKNYEKEIF